MDETHLINDVKERLCYVSLDFDAELALTRYKGVKNTLRAQPPPEPARARAARPNAPGVLASCSQAEISSCPTT